MFIFVFIFFMWSLTVQRIVFYWFLRVLENKACINKVVYPIEKIRQVRAACKIGEHMKISLLICFYRRSYLIEDKGSYFRG